VQISDVPDLAHTRPHAMHWLATATAVAAAVAISGLLQPGAQASQAGAGHPAGPVRNRAPVSAPDPARVAFPLRCGGAGTVVEKKASGDLDGDGSPETVAVVRCAAGSGTPPSGVYVLTGAGPAAPRIVATLVDPADATSVGAGFAIQGRSVLATLLSYSGSDVPRCCPDKERRVSWQWKSGAFVRSDQPASRSV
jgi:hypothetical protein